MNKEQTGINQNSALVISLDFELNWGVRDTISFEAYRENLLGVRKAIPALLELFAEYDIHATWATVGFLFSATHQELTEALPALKPAYTNQALSNYAHIPRIGPNEQEDPFHYGASLVKLLAAAPNQEIATHTFSHYYCLEEGQNVEMFRADLQAARQTAWKYNLNLESLVFPRNQFNPQYLEVCQEQGIKAYRGNPPAWLYKATAQQAQSPLRRGLRLLDSYVSLASHNCYRLEAAGSSYPLNLPASRFLRPYSRRLRLLEPLRKRRILADLSYAAKTGTIYHLWWHPHNFGVNLAENLAFLRQILSHYAMLKKTSGMQSLNMRELSQLLLPSSDLLPARSG